jgi:nitroreductase
MTTIQPDTIISALNWRYATKKFDASKKIPANVWSALEESLRMAPSSFGLEPWRFLVIDSPDLRTKLLPVSWNQNQVVDASHFVVIAGRTDIDANDVDRLIQATAAARAVDAASLEGYRKMVLSFVEAASSSGRAPSWNARQAYIASGFLMLSAALLGVDSCPMEGIDADAYNSILGLSGTGYSALCACALGYRAADDKYASLAKVRFASKDVIFHL